MPSLFLSIWAKTFLVDSPRACGAQLILLHSSSTTCCNQSTPRQGRCPRSPKSPGTECAFPSHELATPCFVKTHRQPSTCRHNIPYQRGASSLRPPHATSMACWNQTAPLRNRRRTLRLDDMATGDGPYICQPQESTLVHVGFLENLQCRQSTNCSRQQAGNTLRLGTTAGATAKVLLPPALLKYAVVKREICCLCCYTLP